jgi:hypothetical protein
MPPRRGGAKNRTTSTETNHWLNAAKERTGKERDIGQDGIETAGGSVSNNEEDRGKKPDTKRQLSLKDLLFNLIHLVIRKENMHDCPTVQHHKWLQGQLCLGGAMCMRISSHWEVFHGEVQHPACVHQPAQDTT